MAEQSIAPKESIIDRQRTASFAQRCLFATMLTVSEIAFIALRNLSNPKYFEAFYHTQLGSNFNKMFLIWQIVGIAIFVLVPLSKRTWVRLFQNMVLVGFFFIPLIAWLILGPALFHYKSPGAV